MSSSSLLSSILPPPTFSSTSKNSPPPLLAIPPSSSPSRFKCSVRAAVSAAPLAPARVRPSAAEVARTVVELAPSGTLSVLSVDGWPLGVGARFVADSAGAPALCLAAAGVGGGGMVVPAGRSSFHVEFQQSRSRTPQCTLLGTLTKPSDGFVLKKLCTRWQKKFGEEIDQDLLYLISVERVLHMEDFKENSLPTVGLLRDSCGEALYSRKSPALVLTKLYWRWCRAATTKPPEIAASDGRNPRQDGIWVVPSEYTNAEPDPLRNFAGNIVEEMNSKHAEDVQRLYSVYVESDFQATDVKMIWVDRLGFDLHVHSEEGVFAARIPFLREVSDEKGVKSSFNMMSHHAWEVEKSYVNPEFEKVQLLKKVR